MSEPARNRCEYHGWYDCNPCPKCEERSAADKIKNLSNHMGDQFMKEAFGGKSPAPALKPTPAFWKAVERLGYALTAREKDIAWEFYQRGTIAAVTEENAKAQTDAE